MDASAHPWPETLLNAFPPISPILPTYKPHPPHSVQNQVAEGESALNSSIIAMEAMGRGGDFSSTSADVKFLGLAC